MLTGLVSVMFSLIHLTLAHHWTDDRSSDYGVQHASMHGCNLLYDESCHKMRLNLDILDFGACVHVNVAQWLFA